ncbi:MAG TPA: hypothetical protein VM639_23725 [Dongiaceae bacterium]|nr:hypothetical protein [Dongiaceae bacterium]
MTGMTFRTAGVLVDKGRDGYPRVKEILWGDGLPRRPRGIAAGSDVSVELKIALFLEQQGWNAGDVAVVIQAADREEAMRLPIGAYAALPLDSGLPYRLEGTEDVWCSIGPYFSMVARLSVDGFAEAWSMSDLGTAWLGRPGPLPKVIAFHGHPEIRWTGQARHGADPAQIRGMQSWEEFAELLSSANLSLPDPIVNVSGLKSSFEMLRHRIHVPPTELERYRNAFSNAMICAASGGDLPSFPAHGIEWYFTAEDSRDFSKPRRLALPGLPDAFSKSIHDAFGPGIEKLLTTLVGRHLPIGRALRPIGDEASVDAALRSEYPEREAPFIVEMNGYVPEISRHETLEALAVLDEMLIDEGLSGDEAVLILEAAFPCP